MARRHFYTGSLNARARACVCVRSCGFSDRKNIKTNEVRLWPFVSVMKHRLIFPSFFLHCAHIMTLVHTWSPHRRRSGKSKRTRSISRAIRSEPSIFRKYFRLPFSSPITWFISSLSRNCWFVGMSLGKSISTCQPSSPGQFWFDSNFVLILSRGQSQKCS